MSDYIRSHDKSPTRWNRLSKGHPTGIYFWYRESPRPLVPTKILSDGRVSENDPPFTTTGMVSVLLQPDGVLTEFHALPPQIAEDAPAKPVDWRLHDRSRVVEMRLLEHREPTRPPLRALRSGR